MRQLEVKLKMRMKITKSPSPFPFPSSVQVVRYAAEEKSEMASGKDQENGAEESERGEKHHC
jgi:hypothetical protein